MTDMPEPAVALDASDSHTRSPNLTRQALLPNGGACRSVRGLALVAALCLAVISSGVQALTLKPDAPARYTVREGDTLWGIAARFLEDPWQWRELQARNPQVDSPERLFAGDVIVLEGQAGQAQVSVERARGDTVRLSPGVRRAPTRDAVPGLPLDRVRVFLKAYQVVEPDVLEGAPTVIAGEAQRLLSGAGDILYAHGQLPAAGTTLGVYRPGKRYGQSGGEFLGLELQRLGHVQVRRDADGVGVLRVQDAVQEIRSGDYLLALDEGGIATRFLPRAPEVAMAGTIIDVPEGVRFIGRFDVVAVDLGSRDGLETGHVLQVMRQGDRVRDDLRDTWVTLPAIEAGAVMVFRVFERVSYALVMRASQPLAVGDRLVVPRDLREVASGGGAP